MTDDALAQQVAALRSMLASIDSHLARAAMAPEGLEDIKGAIDNLRTNVWGILSAGRSTNYKAFVERFRLRRAIDILRTILTEIESGEAATLHPEHAELQMLAQHLAELVGLLQP